MDKPKSKAFYDFHDVVKYVEKTYDLVNLDRILFDYFQRSSMHFNQDVLHTIYEEHLNPEVYNILPKEQQVCQILLNEFGSPDGDYANQQHVNLKVWW